MATSSKPPQSIPPPTSFFTKTRSFLGVLIWIVVFNLAVVLIAFQYSISWAILILCLRYTLSHIPKIFTIWRKIVLGNEESAHLPKIDRKWPDRAWYIYTCVWVVLTVSSFIWLNKPLTLFLVRK
jgi:hypothetical protein